MHRNLDVVQCLHSITKENSDQFGMLLRHWDTVHQELFAIKWALDNCHPNVLAPRIKVVTDDANLQWLKSI